MKPNQNKDIPGLLKKIKESLKAAPKPAPKQPQHRERDMRQESIDMGSHGAAEYFGGPRDA